MRVDGGDGFPHGRTKPFLSSTSTVRDKAFIMISFAHFKRCCRQDGGVSWSTPMALAPDMLSAQPRAVVLDNGALREHANTHLSPRCRLTQTVAAISANGGPPRRRPVRQPRRLWQGMDALQPPDGETTHIASICSQVIL